MLLNLYQTNLPESYIFSTDLVLLCDAMQLLGVQLLVLLGNVAGQATNLEIQNYYSSVLR